MEQSYWRILLIDDDRDDYLIVREMLADAWLDHFSLDWVSEYAKGQEALSSKTYDAVLVDYDLGADKGIDLIREATEAGYPSPMILFTGRGSYDIDVQAMQCGAADYLNKNEINSAFLERSIRFAIERKRSQQKLAESEEHYRRLFETMLQGIVYQDADGKILSMNPAAMKILGAPQDEILGQTSEDREPSTIREDGSPFPGAEHPSMVALRTGHEVRGVPMGVYHPQEGRYRWINISAVPLFRPGEDKPYQVYTIFDDFTERKEMEEAIRLNEQRFRGTFENAAVGIAHVGLDGKFARVNQRLCSITGYTNEELVQKRFQEITYPDDLEQDLAMAEKLRRGDLPHYMIEKRYIRKDGSVVWVHLTGSVQRDPQGEIEYFIAIVQDITLRKQVETALKQSEEFNRRIIESSSDCIKVLDLEGNLLSMSDGGQRLLEIQDLTPYLNTCWLDFWQVEDSDTVSEALAAAKSGGVGRFQAFCPSEAGRPMWWDVALTPIMGVSGKPERILSISRDITQNRHAEERLAYQAMILENTQDAIIATGLDLRITLWNRAAMRIYGWSEEEAIGQDLFTLLRAELTPELRAGQVAALRNQEHLIGEVSHYSRDGRQVIIEYSMIPLPGADGAVTGFVTANRDITRRRRAEEEALARGVQIELQRRLLEQREMERMNIARDLHDGPLQELTAISYAIVEAMEVEDREERLARLRGVQRMLLKQSHELRVFCNELRPPALAPFGLEKAIRSHIESFRERHPEITFHLNLASDRQSLPEPTRMALFRIFQEVLNNVVKHARASEVWVNLMLEPEAVIMEVKDNGQGFSVPQDWMKQARSGHLGLIGMRERASAINGQIAFLSQPGKGASVRITVPRNEN